MAEQGGFSPAEQNAGTWGVAGIRVSISSTTARSAQITTPGVYVVTSDVDCFILQGGSGVNAVVATSAPLWARTYLRMKVEDTTNYGYLAGITSAASGSLYITQVK